MIFIFDRAYGTGLVFHKFDTSDQVTCPFFCLCIFVRLIFNQFSSVDIFLLDMYIVHII